MTVWPQSIGPCSRRDEYQHPVLGRARIGKEMIWSLLRQMADGNIIIPDYQRPGVWTDEQAAAFLGYVMEGGNCPAMYVREVNTKDGVRDELVDGQQRLLAFRRWSDGEIPAVLPSRGLSFWVHESPTGRLDMMLTAPIGRFSGTRAEAIGIYLALNTGGTPHSEEDLSRARRLLAEEAS